MGYHLHSMDTCTTEISQQLELLELLELLESLDLLELLEIRKKHPLVTDSLSDNFKSRDASASKKTVNQFDESNVSKGTNQIYFTRLSSFPPHTPPVS